jgi:5-bromo-4-chloroindolyl phosphate hydrolysis protein
MEEGFFVSYDFVSLVFFLGFAFILILTLVSHKVRLDKIYEDIYKHKYEYNQHSYYRNFLTNGDLWEIKNDIEELKRKIEKYNKEIGEE